MKRTPVVSLNGVLVLSSLDTAASYISRGWAPIPIPYGEKAPKLAKWQELRLTDESVENYFNGQLFAGKQTTEFAHLQLGLADFSIGSTINWSPQLKQLNIFALPFMFPSYAAVDAVEGGEPGERLFKLIERNGAIPIAWGENGFRAGRRGPDACRRR